MEIRPTKILGVSLLLAGLALCGVGLWLLLSPAQYRATAKIIVEEGVPDDGYINYLIKAHPDAFGYDPYFIQYIFENIQSQLVLSNVVESLNLNVEWGKKHGDGSPLETAKTIRLLNRRMSLTWVRNTRLIEISFRSEDPDEAAGVANAIVKAYQDYRLEIRRRNTLNGIKVLVDRFQKEEHDIEAKQKDLDQLQKQLNVPNPDPVDELLKTNFPSYFQAKQELQKMIELHKLLQAKITAEKIDLDIPRTATVQIIDAAQPPKSPAGPNRFLGAVLLAIGLFPTVGGFLIIKSARRPSA